ncbi:ankyrin repeat domain-containing protein [Sphingomonas crusticola]|uniref:ankyrin repeat domain-containing protein n=1 Tax=Sphingomonas crusticola TaxID=1697973 RepID=UPI000E21E003|nr:ankyrin repeat domain-containing protein [Sphingomonas crusticola]
MALKNGVSRAMLCGLALAWAVPAAAQFSDSYNFLKAVRDADGDKATELLAKPGAPVLNTRDPSTGESALHIVIKQHNDNWVAFLLSKGAIPDLKDRQGNTPLHVAALAGDPTAANYLLLQRAKVDVVNNNGETPLILAVHRKDVVVVRQLVEAGADPKIADTIAGKSALDYANDDPRGAALVKILSDAKPAPKKAISGPVR